MNILKYLSKIEDPRRKQGQRYPLGEMLCLVLLGTLAGRVGYRSISRFGKENEKYLSKILKLKHGVPSHVSLTKIVDSIPFKSFEKAVNEWIISDYKRGSSKRQIALDGKAIKSSVRNGISSDQNFLALVNSFCLEEGKVLAALAYENGKGGESEIETLRELVELFGLKGAVFTADANHDSKKH